MKTVSKIETFLINMLSFILLFIIYMQINFVISYFLIENQEFNIDENYLKSIINTVLLIIISNIYLFLRRGNFNIYTKNISYKYILITSLILFIIRLCFAKKEIRIPNEMPDFDKKIILILLASSKEELLFRFFLQDFLLLFLKSKAIIYFIIALLFSFSHIFINPMYYIFAFIASLILSFILNKKNNLSNVILIHIFYNLSILFLSKLL